MHLFVKDELYVAPTVVPGRGFQKELVRRTIPLVRTFDEVKEIKARKLAVKW